MTDSEMDARIRRWLAARDPGEVPASMRDAVAEVAYDQPRSWRPGIAAAVAIAAAAVVVVTLLGYQLLVAPNVGGLGPLLPTAMPPTEAPTPTPELIDRSYRDVGYIGLPAPDAIPSDPSRTELVETFFHPGSAPYKGAIFLYADGRLIWNEYYGVGFARSTGWLEQRLTVDGIELVRALAIGGADRRRLDPVQLPDRLPASAWVDDTIRPYVPNGFAACLFAGDESGSDDAEATLTERLAMLPPDVAVLLRDAVPVPSQEEYGSDSPCLGLDTEASRELDAALRRSGFVQDPYRNRFLLEYHLDADGAGPGTMVISIWFEPILPDGTITCSSCG